MSQFTLSPTFPLDNRRISEYKRRQIVASPINWFGLAGAGIFALATGTGLLGLLFGAALAGGGLYAYWRKQSETLEAKAIQLLIRESNAQQDAGLRAFIRTLHQSGFRQYAMSLGKFLLLKQHIETELHRDEELTSHKAQVETLTDSICEGVCRQMGELTQLGDSLSDTLTGRNPADLESLTQEQNQHHEQIMHAYSTLCETAEKLEVVMNPVSGPTTDEEEAKTLDVLIEQLREETEIATRVHERLHEIEN